MCMCMHVPCKGRIQILSSLEELLDNSVKLFAQSMLFLELDGEEELRKGRGFDTWSVIKYL